VARHCGGKCGAGAAQYGDTTRNGLRRQRLFRPYRGCCEMLRTFPTACAVGWNLIAPAGACRGYFAVELGRGRVT
jgi:hypothetical protein